MDSYGSNVNGEKAIARTQRNYLAIFPTLVMLVIFIGIALGAYFGFNKLSELIEEDGSGNYESMMMLMNVIKYTIMAFAIFFGALYTIVRLVGMKTDYFMLTDRRIYGTQGIFTKKTLDIMLDKVDTIRINSTLIGRLLKYYTIEIISPSASTIIGGNTVNPTLNFVKNAEEFRTKVIEMIEEIKAKEKQSQSDSGTADRGN